MDIYYGISVEEIESLSALTPKYCGDFTALEISGAMLSERALAQRLGVLKFERLTVADIMPMQLCQLIPGEAMALRQEFAVQFDRNIRRAAALGARKVTAGFDLWRGLYEPDYRDNLLELLLCAAGSLRQHRLELELQLRLPRNLGRTADGGDGVLAGRLPPQIGYTLELHVHEGAYGAIDWQQTLGALKFDINSAHLIYELQSGNRLNAAMAGKVLGFFAGRRSEFELFFVPRGGHAAENLPHELVSWRSLIESLGKI